MKGIILGVNLHDYKSNVAVGELVCIDNEFYKLEKIDPSYGNVQFFVNSKVNNEPMNFERSEFSKATIQIFEHNSYVSDKKLIRIGYLSPTDIRNMKAKIVYENDLPSLEIDNIHYAELIGHVFEGEKIIKQETDYEGIINNVGYFKVS